MFFPPAPCVRLFRLSCRASWLRSRVRCRNTSLCVRSGLCVRARMCVRFAACPSTFREERATRDKLLGSSNVTRVEKATSFTLLPLSPVPAPSCTFVMFEFLGNPLVTQGLPRKRNPVGGVCRLVLDERLGVFVFLHFHRLVRRHCLRYPYLQFLLTITRLLRCGKLPLSRFRSRRTDAETRTDFWATVSDCTRRVVRQILCCFVVPSPLVVFGDGQ